MSHELREEANVGRLIAAAAVCLPAPDRFGTWENEVPSLVCNASARRRVDGNSSGTAICGWRTGDNAGESRWFEVVHATMFDGDGFAAKSAVSALTSCPCSHRRAARPGEEALRSPRRHARP